MSLLSMFVLVRLLLKYDLTQSTKRCSAFSTFHAAVSNPAIHFYF